MNPLFIAGQKNIFSSVLRFWFWRYCCFRRFLSKQYGNQTLDEAPFQHHVTYHWKTLDEYV